MVFLPLSLIESSDKTTVRFTQVVRGVRVEEGFVNVLMDTAEGLLLSVQNTSLPGVATFDTNATISAEGATLLAFEQLLRDTGVQAEEISTPELVISQIEGETTRIPRLTWLVQASARLEGQQMPPVSMRYNFDALSGTLERSRSAIRHFGDISGTVQSKITDGTSALHSGSAVRTDAMSRIYVVYNNGADQVTTAEDGSFTIPNESPPLTVTLRYEGEAIQPVQNLSGSDYELSHALQNASGNVVTMNPTASESVTAQANMYYWVTRMSDWILATNPADNVWNGFTMVMGPVGLVNNPAPGNACNATAHIKAPYTLDCSDSGFVGCNDCAPNATCANLASGTVIAHELGHLLIDVYNGFANGDFGEGLSDTFAFYLFDYVHEGEGICPGHPLCSGRRGDNAFRFCGDGGGLCYGGVHLTGHTLGGAFWKMRERLKRTHGSYGGSVADALLLAWMNAYDDWRLRTEIRTHLLILSDVPVGLGNPGLSNGTPHWADIDLGFADQGFPRYYGPEGVEDVGIEFTNVTDPGQTTNETGPYTVSAKIVANYATSIQSATLYYRVHVNGSEPFLPVTMSPSGNVFSGSIPGQTAPAVIEYYLSATDSIAGPSNPGQTAEYPLSIKVAMDATFDQYDDHSENRYEAAEATPEYGRFFVGQKITHLVDDFDPAPISGWDHGGVDDDWDFGAPTGETGPGWADPGTAFSGTNCAGNDLGAGPPPFGAYSPDADNWLTSPSFNPAGLPSDSRTFLRFHRWLSIDFWMNDTDFRHAAEVLVLSNGTTSETRTWMNHRGIPHVDNAAISGSWVPVEVEITSALEGANQAQIQWGLRSNDDGKLFGGWTIDDVEVFTIRSVP